MLLFYSYAVFICEDPYTEYGSGSTTLIRIRPVTPLRIAGSDLDPDPCFFGESFFLIFVKFAKEKTQFNSSSYCWLALRSIGSQKYFSSDSLDGLSGKFCSENCQFFQFFLKDPDPCYLLTYFYTERGDK